MKEFFIYKKTMSSVLESGYVKIAEESIAIETKDSTLQKILENYKSKPASKKVSKLTKDGLQVSHKPLLTASDRLSCKIEHDLPAPYFLGKKFKSEKDFKNKGAEILIPKLNR